jgi:hypothetical protein
VTEVEKAFLERLSGMKQGRCSYALVKRQDAMSMAHGLLLGGHIRERDLGYFPGFQITDKGREYLGGQS